MDNTNPKLERKTRLGWYLYDFANSILVINGSLYFPQWVIGQRYVNDFIYNLMFVLSSIAIIVVGPSFGYVADKKAKSYFYLRISTLVLFISGLMVGIAPLIKDDISRAVIALSGFFFVLVAYQFSLVFYNAMLGMVSEPRQHIFSSARGLAWGWIGGIAAIFFGLLFINGYLPTFGIAGGMSSILPSAVLTGILSLISLRMLKHVKEIDSASYISNTSKISFRNVAKTIAGRTILLFLIGYIFFSDAILTIQNNSTIYMEKVFSFTDSTKAYLFLLVLVASALGAWIAALISKKLGLKKTLLIALYVWAGTILLSGSINNAAFFIIFFGIIGILNGAVWTVARVIYLRLIPRELKNTMFGIYSTFERFATITGPLIWSAVLAFSGKYQMAWISMALLLTVGALFVNRAKTQNEF
jgi:UMF1 family MFS transporter